MVSSSAPSWLSRSRTAANNAHASTVRVRRHSIGATLATATGIATHQRTAVKPSTKISNSVAASRTPANTRSNVRGSASRTRARS